VGARTKRSRPFVTALESWLRGQRARVSKNSETGKAIDYSLKRWTALTRFLDDGRLCMTNNAAERELRAIAVGRRNWTFAAPTKAAGGQPPSTRSLPPPSSTTSIRRPGSPMSSHACRITRRNGSATFYHGTGMQNAVLPPDTWR
jgi:hypothetical protein